MYTAIVSNKCLSTGRQKKGKKLFGKVLSLILIIFQIFNVYFVNSFSGEEYSNEKEARILYRLGLYKGISNMAFEPDLGSILNRETGVCMLLRLFGIEYEIEKIQNADEILKQFKDFNNISKWAKKSIAFAVKCGLVTGYPDGTFCPKTALEGDAYCTLILRGLGYAPQYNSAVSQFFEKGGLGSDQAYKYKGKKLTKGDFIGVYFSSLKVKYPDGKMVVDKLLELKIIDINEAIDCGLVELTVTNSTGAVNETGTTQQPSVTPSRTESIVSSDNDIAYTPTPDSYNSDNLPTEAPDTSDYSELVQLSIKNQNPWIFCAIVSEDGDSVIIFFDRPMGDPAGKQDQFKVFSNERQLNITEASLVDECAFVLTLDEAVEINDHIKLDYVGGNITTAAGEA